MITTSSGTYRKLDKVFTGTASECREKIEYWHRILSPFPRADVVELTRGNNVIAYYRPDRGRYINDKLYMLHWNNDGTVSLWM